MFRKGYIEFSYLGCEEDYWILLHSDFRTSLNVKTRHFVNYQYNYKNYNIITIIGCTESVTKISYNFYKYNDSKQSVIFLHFNLQWTITTWWNIQSEDRKMYSILTRVFEVMITSYLVWPTPSNLQRK